IALQRGTLPAEDAPPTGLPCPRERADEVAAVRSWLGRVRPAVVHADVPPAEPLDGGATLARLLTLLRGVVRDRPGGEPGPRADPRSRAPRAPSPGAPSDAAARS